MKASHGLVIGKFYPPHAGHALLIRAAASGCDRLTVVVMAADAESISLDERVRWMREIHQHDVNVTITGVIDNLPIDYESDSIWRGHVALMHMAASEVCGRPVDAVFTSELYGPELGRRLGARHVCVDLERTLIPISGTRVRADPIDSWEFLAPCVREHFVRCVVLVGAESTGKTTLAACLADRLRARGGAWERTRWVAEYGRTMTIEKLAKERVRVALEEGGHLRMEDLQWTDEDFEWIAKHQACLEHSAAREGGPVLICDTDAFATSVWQQRYMGFDRSPEELSPDPIPRRLYLLTHPDDVPFVQDGIRDGEAIRLRMTDQFAARLNETSRTWHWLRGSHEQRIERALEAIDEWMNQDVL